MDPRLCSESLAEVLTEAEKAAPCCLARRPGDPWRERQSMRESRGRSRVRVGSRDFFLTSLALLRPLGWKRSTAAGAAFSAPPPAQTLTSSGKPSV